MNPFIETNEVLMTAGTNPSMQWNSNLYDKKHDFVFKFGEDLVHLLAPKPNEKIIDLGCGTGYLTNMIAEAGAEVTGIDNSAEMIRKAMSEYPEIDFREMSATDFDFKNSVDAIFSNAVLHWVLDKEAAIKCITKSLKRGGRFVAEFGGKDNVKNIVDALKAVLIKHNHDEKAQLQFWYFPSLAEYAALLEKHGFIVNYASYYNRDTELKDNENGIKDWVMMFGESFLEGIEPNDIESILDEVQDRIRSTNFRNNKWYADYKRLRVVATKP
jgi:trans-aconitate methyltransferase